MNPARRLPKLFLSTFQNNKCPAVGRFASSTTSPSVKSTSLDDSLEAFRKKSTCVMSQDGSLVVCWHPELEVPYEMTQPLPVEAMPTDTVLKIQALQPVREMYRKKHEDLVVSELMALTHTPKYAWFRPKKRSVLKGMNPLKEKRDREYL